MSQVHGARAVGQHRGPQAQGHDVPLSTMDSAHSTQAPSRLCREGKLADMLRGSLWLLLSEQMAGGGRGVGGLCGHSLRKILKGTSSARDGSFCQESH